MNKNLKHKNVWSGTHMGISFEIQNWKTPEYTSKDGELYIPEREHWTYYLYINLDRIPDKNLADSLWLDRVIREGDTFSARVPCYQEYLNEILNRIDFHGGITWYSKESGFDNAPRIIKVGCDFSHYFDEGRHYTLEDVLSEAKYSVVSLREVIPSYKYWCCGNGKLYDLNEGVYDTKTETFYSKECYGDKPFYKELEKHDNS